MIAPWTLTRLGDLAEVKGGKRLPKDQQLQIANNGAPYIRITDWSNGTIEPSALMYVPESAQSAIDRYRIRSGDIFISIVGSIGLVAEIPSSLDGAFLTENAAKLCVTSANLDSSYLKYVLSSGYGQNAIAEQTVGSTQPKLALHRIKDILVPLPRIDEQRAIADVLGALDAKIAANAKLTVTLDAYFMARWTLLSADDSFRNHKLSEFVKDVIGGDWGTSESMNPSTEEVFCIRGADIADLQGSGLGSMPRRFLKPNSLRRRQLANRDLVVEMSGGSPTQSTGRAVLITDGLLKRLKLPLSSSNFCRILRLENPENAYFVYALLRDSWSRGEFFQFENGSTGIKNLAFADFCSVRDVRMPSPEHLQDFNHLSDGLFMQMQSLGEESARLAATRDALLPQLMSGNLRVKDAEKVLEEVGA